VKLAVESTQSTDQVLVDDLNVLLVDISLLKVLEANVIRCDEQIWDEIFGFLDALLSGRK
jgi:hypothetical protein